MKLAHIFFAALLLCLSPLAAHAQMVPGCLGCMPRTGPVYDSTMTTPSPPFTTWATTGDVYIPPREVIITVPGPSSPPAPAGNDPTSFSSALFTCSAGGSGLEAAKSSVLNRYKSEGGRCADTEGLTWWSANLHSCVAGKVGWDGANMMDASQFSTYHGTCGINLGNLAIDQPAMDALCSRDASTRGFVTNAYRYQRSANSDICTK